MGSRNSNVVRRASLADALSDIEAGTLTGTSAILLNRGWWDMLTSRERNDFRQRSKQAGIVLRSNPEMSSQYVEVRGDR